MKNKYFALVAATLLWLATTSNAQATPILLASIDAQAIGSGTGNPALVPTGVVFVLGFKDWSVDPLFECAGYIGCERTWGLGETGTFDFDVNNTDATTFNSLVTKLTNGVDESTLNPEERLSRGAWTLNTDPTNFFPGSIGGGDESFYNIPTGATIDFIRLVVTSTSLTSDNFSTSYNYSGQFQVFGSAAVIPSPGTLLLIALSLMSLSVKRIRRT